MILVPKLGLRIQLITKLRFADEIHILVRNRH